MHHRGCRPIQPMVWLGMGGIWFFLNGDRGIASFNAVRAAGIDVEAITSRRGRRMSWRFTSLMQR